MTLIKEKAENKYEIQQRKAAKRATRRARIAKREANWIRQYEANMADCLGQPDYKLPGGKERK